MVRYAKCLGGIFLFLVVTNTALAAAAGEVVGLEDFAAILAEQGIGTKPSLPGPVTVACTADMRARLEEHREKALRAAQEDETEEVMFEISGAAPMKCPIPTVNPFRELLAEWKSADDRLFAPAASVLDNFRALCHTLILLVSKLKSSPEVLPVIDVRSIFQFGPDSVDEEDAICVGGITKRIATIRPIKEFIAALEPALPILNAKMSVRRNMEHVYLIFKRVLMVYTRRCPGMQSAPAASALSVLAPSPASGGPAPAGGAGAMGPDAAGILEALIYNGFLSEETAKPAFAQASSAPVVRVGASV